MFISMDLQRKLELMRRYDFQGFGNRIGAFQAYLSFCAGTNNSRQEGEKYIEGLYRNLKQMQQNYNTIDFKQLQSEITKSDREDFETLFCVNKDLPILEKVVNEFAAFYRSNNYSVSEDMEIYSKLNRAINSIKKADGYGGVLFRDRRLRLEKLVS